MVKIFARSKIYAKVMGLIFPNALSLHFVGFIFANL